MLTRYVDALIRFHPLGSLVVDAADWHDHGVLPLLAWRNRVVDLLRVASSVCTGTRRDSRAGHLSV